MTKYFKLLAVLILAIISYNFILLPSKKVFEDQRQTLNKSLKIGDVAPNFNLLGHDGKMHKLSDYRGQVVLIDFWAMWCAPCKKKMPKIQLISDVYKAKGLKVISILAMNKGAEKKAATYFKEKKFTIDLLYGNNNITKNYNLKFLPTVVMVGKKGKIIYLTTTPNPNEVKDVVNILKTHK